MSTIYDVAELAGVSSSTVSRTFSKPELISKRTRERVLAAAQRLEYRPNPLASSLKTKKTLLVGLLTADIQNPFISAIARGVQDRVKGERYLSVICGTDGDPDEEMELLREMVARKIDGFVVMAPHAAPSAKLDAYLWELHTRGVPLAFIGDRFKNGETDFVTDLPQAGAVAAVNHLLALGHPYVACLGGPYSRRGGGGINRWLGYQEALLARGLPVDPAWVLETEMTREGGYVGMMRLLESPEPPTAVFALNDLMALGAVDACMARGLGVPEEVSVVGFDDIPAAATARVPLTTVAQPAYELGYGAADLLLGRLEDPRRPPQGRVLHCELRVRESAASPKPSTKTLEAFDKRSL